MSDSKDEYVPLKERWAIPDDFVTYQPQPDRSILIFYPAPKPTERLRPGDMDYEETLEMCRRAGIWIPWEGSSRAGL